MRNKLYYPKTHIITNLRTDGQEWMLEDNTEYKGYYHKYVDYTVMTGAVYDKFNSKKLIPYINVFKDPDNAVYNALKPKKLFISPYQVFPIPDMDDFKASFIKRYFLKKRNYTTYEDIMEINEDQWKLLRKAKGGIDASLYESITINWKLTGPLNDTMESGNNIFGVYDTNKRLVNLKDNELKGLKEFLTNYTELSIYSAYVSNDIKRIFGNMK